ncbi:hypothetical protein KUCAC02_009157, partial [Chaenocephalus aceratus]
SSNAASTPLPDFSKRVLPFGWLGPLFRGLPGASCLLITSAVIKLQDTCPLNAPSLLPGMTLRYSA